MKKEKCHQLMEPGGQKLLGGTKSTKGQEAGPRGSYVADLARGTQGLGA